MSLLSLDQRHVWNGAHVAGLKENELVTELISARCTTKVGLSHLSATATVGMWVLAALGFLACSVLSI